MTDPRDELERARELLHVITARRGETDSFRWLVDRYERKLLFFIRRILDDDDRALDALQEVWLTVFHRIAALKTPEAFRVWLHLIDLDRRLTELARRTEGGAKDRAQPIPEGPGSREKSP
jgi:RNA polymerase sigma-70 factor, ECF subfamily